MTEAFVCVLCGIVFIGVGAMMLYFPPKKINDFYGYRTLSSKKSQERWDFAQRFSAWRMIESGFFLIFVSFVLGYSGIDDMICEIIGLALLVGCCAYMLWRTESALKKKFS